MSPSTLRGRPGVTFYEYDDQGRVARTTTRSAWTPEDRALLVAHRQYLAGICDGCGQPRALAHHPDNDGWFEVETASVCHACTAIARHSDESAKPAEFIRVVHDRDYTARPLPAWPEPDERR